MSFGVFNVVEREWKGGILAISIRPSSSVFDATRKTEAGTLFLLD
jgi:hypothetical protein